MALPIDRELSRPAPAEPAEEAARLLFATVYLMMPFPLCPACRTNPAPVGSPPWK